MRGVWYGSEREHFVRGRRRVLSAGALDHVRAPPAFGVVYFSKTDKRSVNVVAKKKAAAKKAAPKKKAAAKKPAAKKAAAKKPAAKKAAAKKKPAAA